MKNIKFVIILLAVLFLFGCAPVYPESSEISGANPNGTYGVTRYIDKDAGVVCWIYQGYYKAGMDCMLISETLLDN